MADIRTGNSSSNADSTTRFERAVHLFGLANAADPKRILDRGEERPREVVQAERLVTWVLRLAPQASESLQLAAHCQHVERWKIPRSSYPEGRTGYLLWRKELGRFHADRATEILRSVGYEEETIERVRAINQKRSLKLDADVQTMEDALCLSFLEHEIDDFAEKHSDDKIVDIVSKTWRKMSDRGHEEALRLRFGDRVSSLVKRALAP